MKWMEWRERVRAAQIGRTRRRGCKHPRLRFAIPGDKTGGQQIAPNLFVCRDCDTYFSRRPA